MGCPALTYHEKDDALNFLGLWKKSDGSEKSYKYYPFGLQTSSSWTRENTKDNNYLYNAANELNKTSGWYEMFYRGYDPATGRMLQIDPYAMMYASSTTYNYSLNNPVMMNDPSGGLVSVDGHTGGQLRAMYRNDFYNHGYSGSFDDWANDNIDFGSGGTTVIGTDGREYGANKNGRTGYWIDESSIEEDSEGSGGYQWRVKTRFVETGSIGMEVGWKWTYDPIYLDNDVEKKDRKLGITRLLNFRPGKGGLEKGHIVFIFHMKLAHIMKSNKFISDNKDADYWKRVIAHEYGHIMVFMDIVNNKKFTVNGLTGTASEILLNSKLEGDALDKLAEDIANEASRIWESDPYSHDKANSWVSRRFPGETGWPTKLAKDPIITTYD